MSKQHRGFATMEKDAQARIASKGGKSAHTKGRAHEWSVEEARAAGRKSAEGRRIKRGLQPRSETI